MHYKINTFVDIWLKVEFVIDTICIKKPSFSKLKIAWFREPNLSLLHFVFIISLWWEFQKKILSLELLHRWSGNIFSVMSLARQLNSSKALVHVPRWPWACHLPRWMGALRRSLLQDLQGQQRMGRSFHLLSEGRESLGQHPKPWGAQLYDVSAWVQWVFPGGLLPLPVQKTRQLNL